MPILYRHTFVRYTCSCAQSKRPSTRRTAIRIDLRLPVRRTCFSCRRRACSAAPRLPLLLLLAWLLALTTTTMTMLDGGICWARPASRRSPRAECWVESRGCLSPPVSLHTDTRTGYEHTSGISPPSPPQKIAQVGKTDVRNYTYHAMSFIYLLSSPFELRKECSREVIRGHINN